jgi:hypothetical protein
MFWFYVFKTRSSLEQNLRRGRGIHHNIYIQDFKVYTYSRLISWCWPGRTYFIPLVVNSRTVRSNMRRNSRSSMMHSSPGDRSGMRQQVLRQRKSSSVKHGSAHKSSILSPSPDWRTSISALVQSCRTLVGWLKQRCCADTVFCTT